MRVALLLCLCLFACAASSSEDGGGASRGGTGSTEANGDPKLLPGECPAGKRAALGMSECAPVGFQECGEGFAVDASGWGCAPILPANACTGATREAIGNASCVPLGDCNAAFPPAGADFVVSPTGPIDATHFRRISDALARAKSGDLIAVDAGTYRESLTVVRSVTIAGRCAEKVKIDGAGSAQPGIVSGAPGATVRGVSFVNWYWGTSVEVGTITFEDTLFERNKEIGVAVVDGATVKLTRSVVRDTLPLQVAGLGIAVTKGARAFVQDSVIAKSRGAGIYVAESSSVTVDGSVIRDTDADKRNQFGFGLSLNGGSSGEVKRSAFLENRKAGARTTAGTKLTIEESVVRGTKPDTSTNGVGTGLNAIDGSMIVAKKIAISANNGPAITSLRDATIRVEQGSFVGQKGDKDGDLGSGAYVFAKGKIELVDVAIIDSGASGVSVFDEGTTFSMTSSLITASRPSYDRKVMGLGMAISRGGHATVKDSTIAFNHHSGIYLWEEASLDITGTLVRGTKKEVYEDRLGHGILAQDGPRISIDGCAFDGNVGIGLALSAASAVVKKSFIRGNSVGIHVDKATLREAENASEPTLGEVVVTPDTVFEGNATRVGSGELPLPEPPTPKLED